MAASKLAAEPAKQYYSYNQIHALIQSSIPSFKDVPDALVAISGGGLIPARILRTLLKARYKKTVPIRVIGLQLYDDDAEHIGATGVKRTQWPCADEWGDVRNVLLVDEVDDTRTTLEYAVENLRRDLGKGVSIGVFVVHNKLKEKRGTLPKEVEYIAALDVEDLWVVYPWDAVDIEEHQQKCDEQR
ncbi:uncharacterized protein SPPG_00102 [Spizellomyces punctatus DAOM BR117]|uniref:Phosphoribosyltransferase domain-containing protein n=1 Tax=Spizellomyces punctatus (strain DAOM BR117) TaxID=645134 RepID=A0A0L0HTC1_SPIPD|nr:uncharacterized protein SPPG_00102 [Spizellomyces punctatus DAOM BR117]KND04373.1 hypothetical protein SPPG_00102 [Spizellomyces punctatus DAOM BR117]|eukprot:XP_016612412.1 hypothetical protein SPPG_00102 [Spizellomyces punctatus DAOM BR117]